MTYTLADLPMLGGLGEERLRALAALTRRRRYPAGQVLCTEGDPADQLIVLLGVRVKAGRVSADGKEVVLAVEAAPVAFDKTALLVDGPHRATRTALTAVEVAYLPRTTVRDVPARVATWLVRRITDGRVPLHAGQAGLGAEIGATRVSVNRALRSFERRRMIEIGSGEVVVLDRHALARVAAG
ncbi:Crp/Fnr family transcriptional regulator [Nonomuraea turcica]|uniref:Crp/Fnr family transcriptional regulator n=1 Tax=Nonomuraea sp. G32 TaxID=3067274 RepID=UPI00273CA90B|nr:Crp/Fnr family transcriptional regulator [Nonomuraea sp. G32]MDP4506304.1 Crp/Fnr family transcriptional regulator [Nonomuraea sp. G32]